LGVLEDDSPPGRHPLGRKEGLKVLEGEVNTEDFAASGKGHRGADAQPPEGLEGVGLGQDHPGGREGLAVPSPVCRRVVRGAGPPSDLLTPHTQKGPVFLALGPGTRDGPNGKLGDRRCAEGGGHPGVRSDLDHLQESAIVVADVNRIDRGVGREGPFQKTEEGMGETVAPNRGRGLLVEGGNPGQAHGLGQKGLGLDGYGFGGPGKELVGVGPGGRVTDGHHQGHDGRSQHQNSGDKDRGDAGAQAEQKGCTGGHGGSSASIFGVCDGFLSHKTMRNHRPTRTCTVREAKQNPKVPVAKATAPNPVAQSIRADPPASGAGTAAQTSQGRTGGSSL
jgi:hypothetical protein